MEPKQPSGLLHPASRRNKADLALHRPSPELAPYIEHYWIVRWDLRGQEPYQSENLPHPSVHLVFERDGARIIGVVKEKFTRRLVDDGMVFGIKFRPGAFYPFYGLPVDLLTGRTLPAEEVFGPPAGLLGEALLALTQDDDMVRQAESFLLERLPEPDGNLRLINEWVETITADRTILTVEDASARFGLTVRALQRLFSKYVGVSPKWVIRRYRLLEAADLLAAGHPGSWPDLAAGLGYYDQSHFIRDFRSMVGRSPEDYVNANLTQTRKGHPD